MVVQTPALIVESSAKLGNFPAEIPDSTPSHSPCGLALAASSNFQMGPSALPPMLGPGPMLASRTVFRAISALPPCPCPCP